MANMTNMTIEFIEDYLSNYKKTYSNSMDEYFYLSKADVYNIAEDVKQGNAYIYDKDSYIQFLTEKLNDVIEYVCNNITTIYDDDYSYIGKLLVKLELIKLKDFDIVVSNIVDGEYFI